MKRKFWIGGLVGLVIILTIIRYINGQNSGDYTSDGTETTKVLPTETQIPTVTKQEEVRTYNNESMGFSVEYPSELILIEHEEGSVSFSLIGPMQGENTEFFDGVLVGFSLIEKQGMSFEKVVETDRQEYLDVGDQVSGITDIMIKNKNGLKFSDSRGEYLYIDISKENILQVINLTVDPGNYGYKQLAEQVIESIRITD